MDQTENQTIPPGNPTVVDRRSDVELVVTRTFNAPVHIIFRAWTTADLFLRWWAPRSMGVPIIACSMDVRTGGSYSVTFGQSETETFTFFGNYLEVFPNAKLVWTNEESPDAAVTTVTFEARGDQTYLVLHELYPTKEALDEAFIGMDDCMPEQFAQLDELLGEGATA